MQTLQGCWTIPNRFSTLTAVNHFRDVFDDLIRIVQLLNKIYRTVFEDPRFQLGVEVAARENHFHTQMQFFHDLEGVPSSNFWKPHIAEDEQPKRNAPHL